MLYLEVDRGEHHNWRNDKVYQILVLDCLRRGIHLEEKRLALIEQVVGDMVKYDDRWVFHLRADSKIDEGIDIDELLSLLCGVTTQGSDPPQPPPASPPVTAFAIPAAPASAPPAPPAAIAVTPTASGSTGTAPAADSEVADDGAAPAAEEPRARPPKRSRHAPAPAPGSRARSAAGCSGGSVARERAPNASAKRQRSLPNDPSTNAKRRAVNTANRLTVTTAKTFTKVLELTKAPFLTSAVLPAALTTPVVEAVVKLASTFGKGPAKDLCTLLESAGALRPEDAAATSTFVAHGSSNEHTDSDVHEGSDGSDGTEE
ncbi:hypothetical protein FOA52_012638 [Chlamydomonas sp. UWO 241]|nr:hypothetical protein FOA52_012638 [Chlamydomonas sp. UWO 241]